MSLENVNALENGDITDSDHDSGFEMFQSNENSKNKRNRRSSDGSYDTRPRLISVEFENFDYKTRGHAGIGLKDMLFGTKLNILMLLTPVALFSDFISFNKGFIFLVNLLALAPFAERLGFVTEQLALYTNETIGGLLNATFGNVTELILSVFALIRGRRAPIYRKFVQVSLLGSVFSNLLLVLGTSLFLGGWKFKLQKFNKIAAFSQISLLVLSVLSLLVPTLMVTDSSFKVLAFSRFESIVLFLVYLTFLFFQLLSHRSFIESEEDDQEEYPTVGFKACLVWLVVLTILISALSQNIVDAIEGTVVSWGISEVFIGAIVIPIVGNAAEHTSALIFASKNKLDIALSVAVGSAVQISVMALPLCVLIGWFIDTPLDLAFTNYDVVCFGLAVLCVWSVLQDGSTHYLHGVVLVAAYVMIGGGYYFQKSLL